MQKNLQDVLLLILPSQILANHAYWLREWNCAASKAREQFREQWDCQGPWPLTGAWGEAPHKTKDRRWRVRLTKTWGEALEKQIQDPC